MVPTDGAPAGTIPLQLDLDALHVGELHAQADRPGVAGAEAVGSHQHWRVAALTALAGDPHTPRTAVTETVPAQHPLELAWICHQNDAPDWLQSAAAALAPSDGNEAVLRLLTDDELERHRPAAVLQSWLDAPETEGVWTDREVYRAVLDSHHHTLHHLLAECGTQPER
ncbi:hypothetical protein [Streptomyces mirabilis]|uniref:hypothetical protein n=1 Tax=Streptomyces mirabilis TaxID=68239 RepID=UPI0036BC3224